jgi:hypothetical protein
MNKVISREVLSKMTTDEMDRDHWEAFREYWVQDWTQGLVEDTDLDFDEANCRAYVLFEDYVGQEGWTARDEQIRSERARDGA